MALNNDDIKQLIAILQRGLTDDTASDVEPVVKKSSPIKRTKNPSTTTNKKTPTAKKKYLNKFSKMAEFSMCKEDVEIDKKIRKPPPSERKPAFNFIKVQCRVCGRKDKVAPSLVDSIERYKCNKCATGAG